MSLKDTNLSCDCPQEAEMIQLVYKLEIIAAFDKTNPKNKAHILLLNKVACMFSGKVHQNKAFSCMCLER